MADPACDQILQRAAAASERDIRHMEANAFAAFDQLVRHSTRKAATDLDLNSRIEPPVSFDVRKKIQRCRLIRSNHQPPGGMIFQLRDGILQFRFEVLKAPRVSEDGPADIREDYVFGGAIKQFLAQLRFETLKRQ